MDTNQQAERNQHNESEDDYCVIDEIELGGRPNVTERTIDDDNAPSFFLTTNALCVILWIYVFTMFLFFFLFCVCLGLGEIQLEVKEELEMWAIHTYLLTFGAFGAFVIFPFRVQDDENLCFCG